MARWIIQDWLGLTTFDRKYLARKRAAIDNLGTYFDRLEDYECQRIIEHIDKLVA